MSSWWPFIALRGRLQDRLWYSSGQTDAGVGGGMASLALCDCDTVQDLDDKRELRIMARSGPATRVD